MHLGRADSDVDAVEMRGKGRKGREGAGMQCSGVRVCLRARARRVFACVASNESQGEARERMLVRSPMCVPSHAEVAKPFLETARAG